ncbi:50S ribosomal protein L13 [Erysipelothrix rhusiopathiae]|uniref:Large ribosomal subunit protein uL13 n=2 Tax=Erysipelothrix TaxID=1647 RepID=E7FW65_ERYRH|nr:MULTISPECIES: 50S ribosomal protein L13 [Erysipelothrix]CAH2763041.1 50S ribosomal protein L13 [Erysipelothrix sp. A18Y020d]AGN24361.1 50S ribosomal protein L13 [Erysipelothrix rhusiopathiae SY1027]AMS10886.1 50S ribosomal protein L13 [Erysipelothrix rhusiopathiae]AOO66841.1 50S ribosomal protein L13 [Erysipelothrix rhusiopathiae]AWU41747.1 50S ribosomal protein L13 [Erysipelothrix rhusiopathiae]
MRQTTMTKPAEVVRQWYIVDGTNMTLGRLASEVAHVLRGKHKPSYTPNVDGGDYVIVINADKIKVSGDQEYKKMYYNHSHYPGGMRERSTRTMRETYTIEWVERAIHGMLPHTRLGDKQRTHLFVYKGENHPHTAQQPVEMVIKG